MEKIIEKLKDEARRSWRGPKGEDRAKDLEKYLRIKLEEYSSALDTSQEEILERWEELRSYSAINYYQEANQPKLDSDKVKVFETKTDILMWAAGKKFSCPKCSGHSNNPIKCDRPNCDWKAHGLFKTLGEGIYVFSKAEMAGQDIFAPVESVSAK
ncbi:hypothetical protein [Salinicoccus sp. HZC-1]|uniref:hypothetical protein n=1 Tax=Salinicoccus sp. HZC-1 TaxID=3385497 RepID=UPI00398AD064